MFDCSTQITMGFVPEFLIGEVWVPPVRREDEMNQNIGEGLGHGMILDLGLVCVFRGVASISDATRTGWGSFSACLRTRVGPIRRSNPSL